MRTNPLPGLILALVFLFCFAWAPMHQGGLTNTITWHTVSRGAFSNAAELSTHVLETEGDFQTYWTDVLGLKLNKIPKTIDWGKEKLIAINLGRRSNTGYELYVKSLDRINPTDVQVTYVEQPPLEGQVTAQVVISPWTIIKVDRVSGAGQLVFKGLKGDPNNINGMHIYPGPGGGGSYCSCSGCQGCRCGCQGVTSDVVVTGGGAGERKK